MNMIYFKSNLHAPNVFTGLCLMCGLFGALMKPLELTAAIEEDEEGMRYFPCIVLRFRSF